MSKEKSFKVPVQKGTIKINEHTYRWENASQRERDAQERVRGNKDRETMIYVEPKR